MNPTRRVSSADYEGLLSDVVHVIDEARHAAARTVNAAMATTYWLIGRRIVVEEQRGSARADYGEQLVKRLAQDLSRRFGRGFSKRNLWQMRAFYLAWPLQGTLSVKSPVSPAPARAGRIVQTPSAQLLGALAKECAARFPLPWSHYVRLLAVRSAHGRAFYESEALRGGWTIRQLDRQIQSQFYERTALSRDKAALLGESDQSHGGDSLMPDEEIKDPYVLEFLGLKDDYSESQLEDALLGKLQSFLLELGGDFTFAGRQHRLRVGNEWYRVDLLFFHRRLRCLVIIDLKLGKLTHADAGQMHLYLNYAREHWVLPGENPPVGLILCAEKDHAMAKYALEGLSNTVLAAEYRTTLPNERVLAEQIARTRRQLDVQRQEAFQSPPRARRAGPSRSRRISSRTVTRSLKTTRSQA
jgi:predicted nuclease of restriction endonuclease-like (RecB) superfamily